jgi:hypothetical protein
MPLLAVPLITFTIELDEVISVLPIWKMMTPFGLLAKSIVMAPVSPAEEEKR